jgi:hypothetical protein
MTVRRRTDRRRGDLPSAEILLLLLRGCFHPVKFKVTDILERLEDLENAWEQCGESILQLSAFDTEGVLSAAARAPFLGVGMEGGSLGPGKRPWAWWTWSSPEPRREITEGADLSRRWIGEPYEWMQEPYWRVVTPGRRDYGCYEGQAAYLDRLNLWLEGERVLWVEKYERRILEQEERLKAWRDRQQGAKEKP